MERKYGLDIIRIVSMFMVLTLHILGTGGVLSNVEKFSANYYVYWLLEASCYCAVDIFAMLTGYLMVEKNPSISIAVPRWIEAVCISVIGTVFCFLLGNDISIREWIKMFFPLTFSFWKYLNEYIGVVILMPVLNIGIKKISTKPKIELLIVLLMVSTWTVLSRQDPINLISGYSFAWIMLMYIVGGIIREIKLNEILSTSICINGFAICSLLTWAAKIIPEKIGNSIPTWIYENWGISYNYVSPLIILNAIFLLCIGSKNWEVSNKNAKKIIKWMSRVSFGVFLVHTQYAIRTRYFTDGFKFLTNTNIFIGFSAVVIIDLLLYFACGIVVYILSIFLDRTRINNFVTSVFNKILGIITEKVVNRISK